VLAACRSGDWRRVVAVFQPHRYSRTERHWHEFGRAFGDADVLVLCDLYPAGEAPRPGVSGELLLEAVAGTGRRAPLVWRPSLDEVVDYLLDELREGDVLVTIGAGDVTTVGPRVLAGLRERGR
jgi:UDP-N-acetylmuramate--alanine ligase